MAEVFVARQEGMDGFDRMVAIKRILPHLLDDQSFVRMFQDEARLAARLSHPNVIHIYDFGKVDEHFFIAMELMDAVHAGDLIRLAAEIKIPAALIARIGANACAGLHYAHNRKDNEGNSLKLVHRDVSPPNLLISYDGVVKLVDFGIAKAVSSIEQTRPGVVKGKYAFMSPEQTMGQKLDGHSDVFSLGLVLWELLAGHSAVTRDDQILAMQTIRDGKVPAIASVRKDVPAKLAAALHNALQKSPTKRSDAKQFGKELEAFIKSSNQIATNMELGTWLTEHLPPQPVLSADDDSPAGTKRATVATSLQPLSDEIPSALIFAHPADKTDGAAVTKLHDLSALTDLPSVKGNLTQDSAERTPLPVGGADSVVIARDLISQKQHDISPPTPTTLVPEAEAKDGSPTTADDSDLATVVGHGFTTKAAGLDEMDEPTNDLAGPTEADPTGEDPTGEDPTHDDPTMEDETMEDAPPVSTTAHTDASTAAETHESLPPVSSAPSLEAEPIAQPPVQLVQSSGGLAAKAPWVAAAIALLVIVIVASGMNDAESEAPKVVQPEEQPIVFDPKEAAAYRRDGGTGLPPILVTPLGDAGTLAPEAPAPETQAPPPETTQPAPAPKKKKKRRRRNK